MPCKIKGLCSIVILNWNGMKYIKPCFNSILSQTYKNIEIIVVDNGSTDGSKEFIKNNYPDVILIENDKNLGYAAASNQGIRASKGEYVLALNLDVTLTNNFIEVMHDAINQAHDIGSASGKLIRTNPINKQLIDTAGHVLHINRTIVNRGIGTVDRGQYERSCYIFGACAAASLYKREMLEEIKMSDEYYDEYFFLNVEDVDLDWRAQIYGWKCIYTPKAIGYHERGPFNKSGPTNFFYNTRNRLIALIKNENILIMANPLHLFFIVNMLIFLTIDYITNIFIRDAVNAAIRSLPHSLIKRRHIQRNRKASIRYLRKLYSIGIDDIFSLLRLIVFVAIAAVLSRLMGFGIFLLFFFLLIVSWGIFDSITMQFLKKNNENK